MIDGCPSRSDFDRVVKGEILHIREKFKKDLKAIEHQLLIDDPSLEFGDSKLVRLNEVELIFVDALEMSSRNIEILYKAIGQHVKDESAWKAFDDREKNMSERYDKMSDNLSIDGFGAFLCSIVEMFGLNKEDLELLNMKQQAIQENLDMCFRCTGSIDTLTWFAQECNLHSMYIELLKEKIKDLNSDDTSDTLSQATDASMPTPSLVFDVNLSTASALIDLAAAIYFEQEYKRNIKKTYDPNSS